MSAITASVAGLIVWNVLPLFAARNSLSMKICVYFGFRLATGGIVGAWGIGFLDENCKLCKLR